jgi:hypothetical protein
MFAERLVVNFILQLVQDLKLHRSTQNKVKMRRKSGFDEIGNFENESAPLTFW